MYEMNANGGAITPQMGGWAKVKSGAIEDEDRVHLHPEQLLMWQNCAVQVDFVVSEDLNAPNVPLKKLEHTFCGTKVFEDPTMPNNEIHFRDKTGRLLGKIRGLATPKEYAEALPKK